MGMDAMEEALAKKKIDRARIDGQRTKTSQSKESERLRYQRGETQVILWDFTYLCWANPTLSGRDFLFRRYPNPYSASRYDRRFDVANGNLDG
jgi:hypothetical protein